MDAASKLKFENYLYRFFGWLVIWGLLAFFVEKFLMVAFDFPVFSAYAEKNWFFTIQLGIYSSAIVMAVISVVFRPVRSLRDEASTVHEINAFIIRACFWVVLLTGIFDAAIALMRVEGLLILFLEKGLAASLGYSSFVAPYVHFPLLLIGVIVATKTRTLGFHWLALLIVLAELLIVISRFVFSYEQALMGDLVRYWYAALFLFSSAYTLYDEGHVRVDLLYTNFSRQRKGFFNALGCIFWGASTCLVILVIGMGSNQSIVNSPLKVFEVSQAGNIGMFIKYQMAVFIAIFAGTMLIQFVSYFLESIADMRGEPAERNVQPAIQ
ncbi:TRAP transporter small permease subunit [Paracoccaceae bacterium]|nr:TRAP transporter small permease subunit [Paracoccaceae bacterium]